MYMSCGRQQDKRSYSIRYLVDNIKGKVLYSFVIRVTCGLPGADANGDNADLNIPGVSRTCSAEVLALCGDMIPQLYLTYKNEGA